jgi:AcrR family transcriptional regulator
VNQAAPSRKPDPARTREDILRVARDEFAEHGLAGARVDAIAAGTRTTKRMIYYYFGSKEGLYLEVLERAYGGIRSAEISLDLNSLPPAEAMRHLLATTFDYHEAHPAIIRLIANENLYNGRFLKQSKSIRNLNATVIDATNAIIARGQLEGVFSRHVNTVDLHLLISAMCFYRVSNRATFGTLFEIDLAAPEVRARQKRMLADAVLGLLGCRED